MVNDEGTSGPARRPGLNRAALLLGAVILLSGIAIGTGGTWLLRPRGRRPGPPPAVGAEIAARIAERCDLSDEQAEQVAGIIDRRLDELHAIGDEMATRVAVVHDALRDDMKQILTAEQFETWNTEFDRVRSRLQRFRSRHHKPGRPRGRRPWRGRRDPRQMLDRLDADEDGALTADEVPPLLWQGIRAADADADGTVTSDELEAIKTDRPPPLTPREAP